MKSFVRGALAVALLGSVSATAFAADLPSRKEAPVYLAPAPVYSWTGFYVGAEFGGQWGNNSGSVVDNFTSGSYNTSGVVGGGLVGYNYQINQFVLGVEGDLTGSSNQGRFSTTNAFGIAGLNASQNTQYGFGAGVRGRLGYAIDRTLIYATGGWAYETIDQTYNNNLVNNILQQKISTDRSGYTVGGGVEYAFNYNWSARLEYRWTDYGKYVSNYSNLLSASIQQHPTDNTVMAALIYHFAAPAPVVAKY